MAGLKLGVFGGTFDPPHIGHLVLAAEAQEQLGLSRVLWVLTPDPPHKTGRRISPSSDRLAMVLQALAGNPDFELSTIDIDRPPPHYAVDTMRLLREGNPGAALVFLMGGDSLADLLSWHRPGDFVAACDEIGVMLRPGRVADLESLSKSLPEVKDKVRFIRTPLLEIASSELRERIAGGRPYRYYVPEGVYRVIEERRLYRR